MNMVNLRREFFRVTLDEVRAAVARHFGEVTFRTVPEAEEFRKTLAMRQDTAKLVEPAPIVGALHPAAAVAAPTVDLLSLAGEVRVPQKADGRPSP